MKIIIKEKKELMEILAQDYIKKINEKSNINLGLATGSTPEVLYGNLVQAYNEGKLSFKGVKSFNLDEYLGLDKNDKNSYHTFMNEHLFSKVDMQQENINFPPTDIKLLEQYEQLLKENPIDIQLLGIGTNGHIAFNEPGGELDSTVRVVDLAQKTINDNARFFSSIEEVPTQAVSMGLKNITDAKQINLVAIGQAKAPIIKELLKDDVISKEIPASVLKEHKDVTLYLDLEAAKSIEK